MRGRGNAKSVNLDVPATDDPGERQKVAGLSAGAGTNIGAVERDLAQVPRGLALGGIGMTRDGRFQFRKIESLVVDKALVRVDFSRFKGALRAVFTDTLVDVVERLLVAREDSVLAAGFDSHVGDGHAVVHGHGVHARSFELHGPVGGAVESDLTDQMQDHVLCHDSGRECAVEPETHGFRNFDQQLARAQDEARVGVADASGELIERPSRTSVGVRSKKNFTGARVPFQGQGGVTDAGVFRSVLALQLPLGCVETPVTLGIVDDVVKIFDPLFLDEIAENVDVTIRH